MPENNSSPTEPLDDPTEPLDDAFRWAGSLHDQYEAASWEDTPLGPVSGWPQSLRTALSICLASALPSAISWGPELTFLYNEAFAPTLGDKHPDALGTSHPLVFWESWDRIRPAIEQTLTEGTGSVYHDVSLPLLRHGFMEDCYFNYGRSPLTDESGAIVGTFTMVVETTERVLAERELREQTERLVLLQRLTQRLATTMTDTEIATVVLTEARPLLGASVGSVTKLADGWAERVFDSALAGNAGWPQSFRLPLDTQVPTCEAIRSAAPVILHTAAELEDAHENTWREALLAYGLVVAFPMLIDEKPVGALSLGFVDDRILSADETALLQALADLCGQALQRAHLLAVERAHRRSRAPLPRAHS